RPHRLAPDQRRAGRGSHRRARAGRRRRARHPRVPAGAGRALRRAVPPAGARGGAGSVVSPGEEDDLGRAYDHRLMRRLMGYLRPYRGRVAFAVAVVVADVVAQLAGPWLTMQAIDNGIRHKDLVYLDRVAMLYLAVLLVSLGLGYL